MTDIPTYHRGERNFGTGYDMLNRIEELEAKLAQAVEAFDDIAGAGFSAPMTWAGSDEEWERRRANIFQQTARTTLAQIKGEGE